MKTLRSIPKEVIGFILAWLTAILILLLGVGIYFFLREYPIVLTFVWNIIFSLIVAVGGTLAIIVGSAFLFYSLGLNLLTQYYTKKITQLRKP